MQKEKSKGGTVSQFMLSQITAAYETGDMPKMLPDLI
jgi:hypothetical protein